MMNEENEQYSSAMVPAWINKLYQFFWYFNIFNSQSNDAATKRKERLMTRIYIILLAIILIIITIVFLVIERTTIRTRYNPSDDDFQYLINEYGTNLDCSCSSISIPYQTFVKIDFEFHQVCRSHFVNQSWIELIYLDDEMRLSMNEDDLRLRLSHFWQIIRHLCQLGQMAMNDVISQFQISELFSQRAVSKIDLLLESQAHFAYVMNSVQSTLNLNLLTVRRILNGNQIVSGLKTNFFGQLVPTSTSWFPILSQKSFENCSCLNINGCLRPAAIYESHDSTSPSYIDGIVSDCLMLDATLRSTLTCYYDESCVQQLYPSVSITDDHLLNKEENQKFNVESTVQEMFDNLMINNILLDVNFQNYYQVCHPDRCIFSYVRRFNLFFTITTIISIFGGLSTALRLLIPFLINRLLRDRKSEPTNKFIPNRNLSE